MAFELLGTKKSIDDLGCTSDLQDQLNLGFNIVRNVPPKEEQNIEGFFNLLLA